MKNAFITGASRGIGQAIAETLSDSYDNFYLQGRDEAALKKTAELIKNLGKKTNVLVTDLADPEETTQSVNAFKEPSLELLVNNAGYAVVKPFEDLTLEEWNRQFAVNVTAPFLLTKSLLPKLVSGSTVVNILSIASKSIYTDWSAYCMSKFAADGFFKTIREELRPKGIRVVNVYPGAVRTDIWKDVPGDWSEISMMTPREVADAVKMAVTQPEGTLVEDITLTNMC